MYTAVSIFINCWCLKCSYCKKSKEGYSSLQLTATGTHIPYGITQCYLPPGRGDIPAFTPAEAGTRFSDPGGMQGWVDLGGWLQTVYPYNGHVSWTNRARCWLTSLMRPTTLTTTPSCHMNYTCLYSPAAGHDCPSAITYCAYSQRDGQAELIWLAGRIST